MVSSDLHFDLQFVFIRLQDDFRLPSPDPQLTFALHLPNLQMTFSFPLPQAWADLQLACSRLSRGHQQKHCAVQLVLSLLSPCHNQVLFDLYLVFTRSTIDLEHANIRLGCSIPLIDPQLARIWFPRLSLGCIPPHFDLHVCTYAYTHVSKLACMQESMHGGNDTEGSVLYLNIGTLPTARAHPLHKEQ